MSACRIFAEGADPPSLLNPAARVPAIVAMIPEVVILRMRLFPRSEEITLELASTTIPAGAD
jgi:hypothetical protein